MGGVKVVMLICIVNMFLVIAVVLIANYWVKQEKLYHEHLTEVDAMMWRHKLEYANRDKEMLLAKIASLEEFLDEKLPDWRVEFSSGVYAGAQWISMRGAK